MGGSQKRLTTKSGVGFFIPVSEDPTFSTQNNWKWPFPGAKNWVFGRPNPKTDTTFCSQLFPKMVDETLVSYEYITLGRILGKFWKSWIFGSFLADFLLKNPKIKTLCCTRSIFGVKNLIFVIWVPYIQRQLNLSGWFTNNSFAFWGTPFSLPPLPYIFWTVQTWGFTRYHLFISHPFQKFE